MPKGGARVALVLLLSLVVALPLVQRTVASNAPSSPSIWYADHRAAYQVDAATHQIRQTIPLADEPTALAIDPRDQSLWVLAHKQLQKFDANTSLVLEVDLKTLVKDIGDPKTLLLHPYDGTLWISANKHLLHVSSQGQLQFSAQLSEKIEALTLSQDGSVWLATHKQLLHLSAAGITLATLDAKSLSIGEASHIAVDALAGILWVAAEDKLVKLNANDLSQPASVIPLPAGTKIEALALDPFTGALALASKDSLLLYDRSGTQTGSIGLSGQIQGKLSQLVFEPVGQGWWVGSNKTLVHLSPAGAILAILPVGQELEALAAAPGTVVPVLTLLLPPSEALTNNPQPPIRFGLSALCSGNACNPGEMYLTGLRFDVTLDQQAIGSQMVISGTEASYLPDTRLPEGLNTIVAQVTDGFGHLSNIVNSGFTIDTIPPRFLVLTPANDSVLTVSEVVIEGQLDDPGALVILENLALLGGEVLDRSPGYFGFRVPLSLGLNTFALTARDPAGNSASVTLRLTRQQGGGTPPDSTVDPTITAPPLDRTVATTLGAATSFLYTGANPVQTGVAPGTIDPRRVAVLRGKVLTREGTALEGVRITILGRPEFGQTLTRVNGAFDMAVNGGGIRAVRYEKDGFLPVQRRINAPWQDYTYLPDVAMIPRDNAVTPVDLAASPGMQVARANVVTDGDGMRRATLLFPQGTTAQLVFPDGHTQAISTLNVRATEYTVGPNGQKAMPALLPPSSAYTYAIELSVDQADNAGAKDVRFSQSVPFYIENFLNINVGAPVPLGSFDRDKDAWVPSDSGRVVKILGVAGGLANLDIDGSNAPASAAQLAALGVTDAERAQLASLYSPGQSLWRMPIPHFSSWDANMGFSPPEDAEDPAQPEPNKDEKKDDPCLQSGSLIECENQTLGESLNATGTPFSLNYRSDRAPGRKASYSLDIPLSGASVPASLKRIDLQVYIAGQAHLLSFPAQPDQRHRFTWNGNDVYGRTVQGTAIATVIIGYVYDMVYTSTARFGYNGNGVPITFDRGRGEITLTQERLTTLGAWDARAQGLGGWTLDAHHAYEPSSRVLYLGDGSRRSAHAVTHTITTIAGNGALGYSGDGGPAVNAAFNEPMSVVNDVEGNLYITDTRNHCVRKVGLNGIVTKVAGVCGARGYNGDNIPAVNALINDPHGMGTDALGNVYIADNDNSRIRKVDKTGIITTIAGTGALGYGGDEGPAVSAIVNGPDGIATDASGNILIADTGNQRIRKISPDGRITTIAGTGVYGFNGDNRQATTAQLFNPWSLTEDRDGNLYIADIDNHRIRKVAPNGVITTVAGIGTPGFGGDGGPATAAQLYRPFSVAVDAENNLYIADTNNNRIRKVSPDGIITTVAGDGTVGFRGDGGPATLARFNGPTGLTVDALGNVLVTDSHNQRIRRISRVLPTFSNTEIAVPSADGSLLYVFSESGRHLRTVNALTNANIYQFAYDVSGNLIGITDGDGNTTVIERDGTGNPTAVVAPDGQRTVLGLDANGYLASVANPAGETTQMAYTADGLLTGFTNPRGFSSTVTYDTEGRLMKDVNAAGGFWALARTEDTVGHTVSMSSAEGRTTNYRIERLVTGGEQRRITDPAGLATTKIYNQDGAQVTTAADGTVSTETTVADPRFGIQAPLHGLTLRVPSGLMSVRQAARSVNLSNPNDLLSLVTQTDTVTLNGKTWQTVFTAAAKQFATTSPVGRQTLTTVDAQGRPTQAQVTGLLPVSLAYDTRGRPNTIAQGSGAEARQTSFAYNPQGYVGSITDALGRVQGFAYDAAGRVTQQTLPDGRVIAFSYDANGNVTSIQPPSRPLHAFAYTPVDLEEQYTPPVVTGVGTPATQYAYNLDKQLTRITRPDGQQANLAYDAGGRLSTLTFPTGQLTYGYHPTTGKLNTLTTADGQSLAYAYDGFLLTGETLSGSVAGSVGFTYDNDFRVTGLNV
ncbi:MAG: hypothetical protein HZA69_05245, partial [Gammaproteobacteria bacterium]|nr:hypothetical protein [Gammaproteobacteria bacterium]